MVTRPILLLGAEAWALRKEERLLQRMEMWMLRGLMGISLRERERNEDIRRWVGVTDISEKIREAHLCWLRNVLRSEEGDVVWQVIYMDALDSRRRDRPKSRGKEAVQRGKREDAWDGGVLRGKLV